MTTYATQQNMIDRFGADELIQLTDRDNLGVIDVTVLGQALTDADAEINAYIGSRYTLPLSSVPPTITKFAADIARYQLYDVRASDVVKARYDDAIKFFKLLVAGTVSLGLDLVNQPVADTGSIGMNRKLPTFAAGDSDGNLADY